MSEEGGLLALDGPWVRRSFERAAAGFDAAAVLHAEVRDSLLERLDVAALSPRVVVDAGAGTGHASRALKRRYPRAQVIATDSCLRMLCAAPGRHAWLRRFHRLCADAARLPLADASVDLIFSNLMLHWCDPDAVFAEFRRVLAPRGLFCFTSFGPDTLSELRAAWAQVDEYPHVHCFIDMHDLGDALVRAGFAAPVLDVERYTVSYSDVRGLMGDLKAVGARNATAGRPRGLMGPGKFAALQAAYEAFRRHEGLPATHEVVFGHAWAPAGAARSGLHPGSKSSTAAVSLDEIKRELAKRRGV